MAQVQNIENVAIGWSSLSKVCNHAYREHWLSPSITTCVPRYW